MAKLSDFIGAGGGGGIDWTFAALVTDSTNITFSSTTPVAIGSSFSITVPTNGLICIMQVYGAWSTVFASIDIGFRTSSVNYMAGRDQEGHNDSGLYPGVYYPTNIRGPVVADTGQIIQTVLDVEELGIPTGTITAELMGAKPPTNPSSTQTLNGATMTSRFAIYTGERV